jgi:hypothetical protein
MSASGKARERERKREKESSFMCRKNLDNAPCEKLEETHRLIHKALVCLPEKTNTPTATIGSMVNNK